MSADMARRLAKRVDEFLTTIDGPDLTASQLAREALTRFESKCSEYVRIAVSGTSSAGKSELVNALVERKGLLPTGAGRSSVNSVCVRLGPAITEESAWVEWLTYDEAQWMLNELDAREDAKAEAQAFRDTWMMRPPAPARQREQIAPDEVGQAATDQFKAWQMVRRVVLQLPISGSAWASTQLGSVGIELVDLPGHGTTVARDELVNRQELHSVETVLFVADKPQTQVSGPLIEKMVTLLKETGTGRPARRVLPVLNKADLFVEGALNGKRALIDAFLTTAGRFDITDLLRELELADMEQFQRGLVVDGPAVPLLAVAVDGYGQSIRVSETARKAIDDLCQLGRRLPAGEDQHRISAVATDGGISYLRAAIAKHARHNGLRALIRDRADAADGLARELELLPESVRELAEHPLAIHMELREAITDLDIDGALVGHLLDLLERWVTGDVCSWPFWRTAANSVNGGLVSMAAIASGQDGGSTKGAAAGAASTAAGLPRRQNLPAHLLKKLEERQKVVGQSDSPAGAADETLLPRSATELYKWFASAYEKSLLRLVGDFENPRASEELVHAVQRVWARPNELHNALATKTGSTAWEAVLDIELYAEVLADDLAGSHRPDEGFEPRRARLPVNQAVDVLPWARSTASSPHNESYWQPQHLAVVVYERLSLIESLLGQLAATIRASARYAALVVYNGVDARDENPHGRLPLRNVMRAVGDLRPSTSIDGASRSVTQLIADLRDVADKERQSVFA